MGMGARRILQMGERIAIKAVCAALKNNECGFRATQKIDYAFPLTQKLRIASAGRHRNIQLGSLGLALARFGGVSSARVQKPAVLVYVSDEHLGITFIRIVKSIAVVNIDVDVSDAPDAIFFAQRIDNDAAIVEHTETRTGIATGMVAAADRLGRSLTIAVHDALESFERCADNCSGRVVDTRICGCVAIVDGS